MANYLVLGLFEEVSSAAAAIEGVRRIGVPDNRVSVMSGTPIRSKLLGRRPARNWLGLMSLLGALLGLGAAVTLLVGAPLLYPMYQGGQPLIPIPPSIIITFELTMMGTMWVTFGGFWLLNRFPRFGRPVYDPRITAGMIGVLVEADEGRAGRVVDLFKNGNAADVQRVGARPQIDNRAWGRWLAVVGVLLGLVLIIAPLFVYDVIRIPFGTQMDDQASVPYDGGPRLAAPANSVPIQGPVFVSDQPATQPVPANPNSLQRGQVLFDINCALCHGPKGDGNGRLSGFFTSKPFDLTGAPVQALSDQQIFTVISKGFGVMPPLHENLDVEQRWDVVDWVRNLKK